MKLVLTIFRSHSKNLRITDKNAPTADYERKGTIVYLLNTLQACC